MHKVMVSLIITKEIGYVFVFVLTILLHEITEDAKFPQENKGLKKVKLELPDSTFRIISPKLKIQLNYLIFLINNIGIIILID